MAASRQFQIRLSEDEIKTVQRVAEAMKSHPTQQITTATVLRAALADFAAKTAPKKSRKIG